LKSELGHEKAALVILDKKIGGVVGVHSETPTELPEVDFVRRAWESEKP
jgi:hypothetical protein